VRVASPHARLTSSCWTGSVGRDWLPAERRQTNSLFFLALLWSIQRGLTRFHRIPPLGQAIFRNSPVDVFNATGTDILESSDTILGSCDTCTSKMSRVVRTSVDDSMDEHDRTRHDMHHVSRRRGLLAVRVFQLTDRLTARSNGADSREAGSDEGLGI